MGYRDKREEIYEEEDYYAGYGLSDGAAVIWMVILAVMLGGVSILQPILMIIGLFLLPFVLLLIISVIFENQGEEEEYEHDWDEWDD